MESSSRQKERQHGNKERSKVNELPAERERVKVKIREQEIKQDSTGQIRERAARQQNEGQNKR